MKRVMCGAGWQQCCQHCLFVRFLPRLPKSALFSSTVSGGRGPSEHVAARPRFRVTALSGEQCGNALVGWAAIRR